MDELRKETDKKLKEIEDKLEGIYKDAESELREKWDNYMQRAEKRVERYEEALQDALKTGDEDKIAAARKTLTEKKQAVLYRDKQFADMVDGVTDRLAKVNQIATDYVNEQMPGIYSYNYNGVLREAQDAAESGGISGIAFNMIDEATVKRMVKEGEIKLPKRKIDIPKDQQWNRKAITAQMMQGIVQGESIPQMSKRLQAVTDMDKNAAIRNARTMTTEAENGGRLASMEEAEQLGLEYEKTWMATHDERTRESHARIDGETVPLDEPFSNGLQYPGDPSGAPEEVYNCRCSLVRKLVGFKGRPIETKCYEPTYFEDLQAAAPEAEETAEAKNEKYVIPEVVQERIDNFAASYATAKFEHTMTVDEEGNIMYQGGGKKTSVSTPRAIANNSEGCHQIHNHPEDVVFSAGDIAYMEEFGLKTSTIVTSGKREFTLVNTNPVKKPDGGWNFAGAAGKALEQFEEEAASGRRELIAMLNKTDMTREEKLKEIKAYMKENSAAEKMIVWYKENAEKYGFEFMEKKVK